MNPLPKKSRPSARPVRTLAIDVGGTGLKASILDEKGNLTGDRVRVDTPYPCPPKVMVNALTELVKPLSGYSRVSIGFPGYIRGEEVVTAPHFGNEIWNGFNLAKALSAKLGKPVRLLNDADMQGLAAMQGQGLELVITLGTGVGSALFREGELMPHLELAHHPFGKSKTYNQYLGKKALDKIGKKKWNKRVTGMIDVLSGLFNYDTLYIGGGNSANITSKLPPNVKLVSNENGLLGAFVLWNRKRK